jgi:HD-like signal output (HDOD) protein
MRRILFVDDEPSVLQGLRRMLHDQRGVWEMDFVSSGAEALEKIRLQPVDVVVTDMRMPVMDGANLLKAVRQVSPETVRIVLTGQTDWDRSVQSVEDAHQFLLKPCEKHLLKAAIQRSESLEALVLDAKLRSEVAQLSRLPMLGPAADQLLREMALPGASLKKAAGLVEQDPGMAALTLKMVHSAFFALPVRVERPAQAALLLGFDNLKNIVMASEPFHAFNKESKPLADRLWQVGADVAYEARQQAAQLHATREEENDAFTAGMLHEIGVLVLATLRPAQAQQWEAQHPDGWPADDAEQQLFGATHAAVGGYLLALWGLPYALVNAVAWHHQPERGEAGTVLQSLVAASQNRQRSKVLV